MNRKKIAQRAKLNFEKLEDRKLLAAVTSTSEIVPFGDLNYGGRFGSGVDISGDFAVISARPASNGGVSASSDGGEVFLYQRDDQGNTDPLDDQWSELVQLPRPEEINAWGDSVAIDGNRLAVSAYEKVFIYDFDGTSWNLSASVESPSASLDFQYFGTEVDLSGETLAVATPNATSGGRVDVFKLDAGNWNLETSFEETAAGANQTANNLTVEGDTISFISRAIGETSFSGSVYARDASGQWQQALLFLDSNQTVNIDLNSGGNELVVGANGNLETYVRQSDGSFAQAELVTTYGIQSGELTIDGDIIVSRSGSNGVATRVFYRDAGGQWNFDSTRAIINNQGQNAFAIDGNTILEGDQTFANDYGRATFTAVDPLTSETTELVSVRPQADFGFGANARGFFGRSTAVGDGFVAVSSYNRATTDDQGRVGFVTIYTRDDQGTNDNSDDTYTYFGQVEAEPDADSFGIMIDAQGDELYVRSRENLFVYQFDGTDFSLQQTLSFGNVRFNGLTHQFRVDGDAMVITNTRTVFDVAADATILERVGGQWQVTAEFAFEDLLTAVGDGFSDEFIDVDISGDRVLLASQKDEAVVLAKDAGGNWSAQQTLSLPFLRHGTIDGDRIVLGTNDELHFYQFDGTSFALTQTESVPLAEATASRDLELRGDQLVSVTHSQQLQALVTTLWGNNGSQWGVSSNELETQGAENYRFIHIDLVGDELLIGTNRGTGIAFVKTIGNQISVAQDATFDLSEDSPTGTVVGSVEAFDSDFEDATTITIVSGNEAGVFAIDSDGQITVADASQLDFDSTNQYFLEYQISDGQATATASVTVNIIDVQSPATIGGDLNLTTTEDARVSGALTISDPDGAAEEAFLFGLRTDGIYGRFNMSAQGDWTYTPSSSNPLTQGLREGEVVTETFTVGSIDGTSAEVVVTIIGVNDQATFPNVIPVSVDEDATAPITGQITVVDRDAGESEIVASQQVGSLGTFEINADGQWNYTVDNAAADSLRDGEDFGDFFIVTSLDGTEQDFLVSVIGVNDSAIISGIQSGTTDEDATAPIQGQLNVIDVEDGQSRFVADSFFGEFGTLDIDFNGNWDYVLDNALVQDLVDGESVVDNFTVSTVDGTTIEVTVTISGNNDVATFVGTTTGTTTEDATTDVTGTVTVSDVDSGQQAVQTQSNVTGNYGTFSVDANGVWTFEIDNAAVQGLDEGQSVTDTFNVVSLDDSATVAITVTITGITDETPVTEDPNFVEANVNDWGSGFQVTYDYTVTEDSILDGNLQAWIIDSGYSGPGTLVGAWASNFNGPTSTTPSFAVTNANAGYQPELQPGDTFSVTFQVNGAGYSADDFSSSFLDIDPPPVVISASDIDISTSTGSQWNAGFVQNVTISNQSQDTTDGWSILLDVPDGVDFTLVGVWNANFEVLANGDILFTSKDYNSAIGPNGSVNFGFQAAKSSSATVNLFDEFFSWV